MNMNMNMNTDTGMGVGMDAYLSRLAATLRLDPDETRGIVAEVRSNLEDLAAYLCTQGYDPAEADAEALRRFDEARGLARALRRAHRRAPLPLQMLGALLVATGVAGVALGANTLMTAGFALVQHTDSLMVNYTQVQGLVNGLWRGTPWVLDNAVGAVVVVAPGMGILAAAAVSLWLACTVLFGMKRVRWRRVGAGAGIVALADLVLGLFLLGTIPRSTPRPMAVPAQARLIAAGLSFRPAPGQPTGPVVVDRVFADRTATYVQYHIPDPARDGLPIPALLDERGRPYPLVRCDPCDGFGPLNGHYPTRGAGVMMPWHTAQPAMAQFAPLDAGAHYTVIQFGDYGNTPIRETVRVAVNLGGWRRLTGGTHPFIVVSRHGVRVNLTRVVRGITSASVDYTVDATPARVPRGSFISSVNAWVSDAHGQPMADLPSAYGNGCRYVDRGGGHCGPELTIATVPKGTHLTLVVDSLSVLQQYHWQAPARTLRGPWRIPFVMP